MTPPIVQDSKDGAILTIHVQPNAAKSECAGLHGQAVKIRVAAPPVDGRANDAVLAFLADRLRVAPSMLSLQSGASGRHKRVLCRGLSAAAVLTRLGVGGGNRGGT